MHIQLKNIHKTYNPQDKDAAILDEIDISAGKGDFIIVLGQSGCGKSTLLNIVAGLIPPTSGQVLVNGEERIGPDPSRSMLFQQPCLLPWLNVQENIAFGCKLRGEKDELDYRVTQFIEIIGLSGCEKMYPSELSVGMACRVSLARALIGRPDLILLDEPFASLDTFTRTRLQEELINIWLSENFTAILVTHDIDEAVILGTRIVLLGDHPGTIQSSFNVDLPYPRDITDESFFKTRTWLLREFKRIIRKK